MATFAELRARLAREMDLYYTGTITGEGAVFEYIEDDNLRRFTDPDVLVGGDFHTFITDNQGRKSYPQSRPITGFVTRAAPDAARIELEYPLELAVAGPIQVNTTFVGDTYEVYRALTSQQWDWALREAIRSAWPMIFQVERVRPRSHFNGTYNVSASWGSADNVVRITVKDEVNFPGFGEREIPRARWTYEQGQWGDGNVVFDRPLPSSVTLNDISMYVTGRYPLYEGVGYLNLDYDMDDAYLMAQSRANAYSMLVDATQRQAAHANYATQMQYFQQVANARKAEVASMLSGQQVDAPEVG